MEVPDMIGYTLKDAKRTLKEKGIHIVSIQVTSPPKERSSDHEDFYRVIQYKIVDSEKVKLIICKPL